MSFQAMSLVASIKKCPEICVIKKCLLLCMANYADDKFELWPSYKTLSEDACISRRSAVTHIDQLINLGIISRQRRPINNTYSESNAYRLEVVQWLKSIGFELRVNDNGFIIATPIPSAGDAPPSAGDAPPLVQEMHHPSAGAAPNPIIEPIIKPITEPKEREGAPEQVEAPENPSEKEITKPQRGSKNGKYQTANQPNSAVDRVRDNNSKRSSEREDTLPGQRAVDDDHGIALGEIG